MKLFAILLLFYYSFSLSANEKVYRLGVENIPYLPFYETVAGEFRGYARELFDAFAEDQKIKFEYVPLPVKRLYKDYLEKESSLDFKFPDNSYWAKDLKGDRKLFYSKGLASFTDGVMLQPKNSGKGKDNLRKLGIVRGFTPWDYLEEINKSLIIKVENNSLESILKLCLLGRVDGVYVNVDVANYILNRKLNSRGKLVFDEKLPFTKASYSFSSLRHKELIKKFNSWLEANSKLHESLLEKWKLKK